MWGPQGHLAVIQNKNSLMHQTLTDQQKILQSQKEIYNYIYRQKKLKNLEDNKE